MFDIRRLMIVIAVAALYGVLIFSTIGAVYPSPEWNDFCEERYDVPRVKVLDPETVCPDHGIAQEELDACTDKKGYPAYDRDAYGCVTGWECSMCQKEYRAAQEVFNFWSFIIAAILGVVGVIVGLVLPMEKGSVHEWVGSGFMLGGIISLFIGTAQYFGELHRWARPLVILIELVLVIFLAYKKLAPKKSKKKR